MELVNEEFHEVMPEKRRLEQWATIYRGLGSQNRLRILQLLSLTEEMSVGDLAEALKISFKNTSRNLRILQSLDLIRFEGKKDRVYYSLSSHLDPAIQKIIGFSIR